MSIFLLDDTLRVEVFYEHEDKAFEDNICLRITESCAPDERLFVAGETNIYITAQQARQLGEALLTAVIGHED